jgi:hypothetical protein
MGFGIILLILFGLLAAGILVLIICMLIIGLRRISKKSKSVEKPATVKTDTETPAATSAPSGTLPGKDNTIEKTP